jgi:hypothetical protein
LKSSLLYSLAKRDLGVKRTFTTASDMPVKVTFWNRNNEYFN